MVRKRESTDRERINRFLIIFIALLSTKVVNFDHFGMVLLEKSLQIFFFVPEHSFKALSWESARNNTVGDVRQVQVELLGDHTVLIGRDDHSDFVHIAATLAFHFLFLFLLFVLFTLF